MRVGRDVDALAEERAGAVLQGAAVRCTVGRAERGLLARVADGVGVGDVVRRDVEACCWARRPFSEVCSPRKLEIMVRPADRGFGRRPGCCGRRRGALRPEAP
jgi:hypothetical protein